jgi:hypothetical protein
MDSEKQIDIKEKLDALGSLPGEAFNKDTAWDKLHQRLEKKPRRNKAVWYWAAAVLLPLAILMIWISSNKKEIILAKKITHPTHETTKPATQLSKNQKDLNAVSPVATLEKNKPIKRNVANLYGVVQTKKSQAKINNASVADTLITNETLPMVETKIIPPGNANSTGIITTAAVVTKKLRVVHINELETAPAADPERLASSSNHDQNNFKFRFQNNHSSVNTPAADRQEYTSGIKIPLNN